MLRALMRLNVLPSMGWEAYNAAGVWGVEPNASYHPNISNLLFQPGFGAVLNTAHRETGATGLYQMKWTVDSAEKNRTGGCKSPIPRFRNSTGEQLSYLHRALHALSVHCLSPHGMGRTGSFWWPRTWCPLHMRVLSRTASVSFL